MNLKVDNQRLHKELKDVHEEYNCEIKKAGVDYNNIGINNKDYGLKGKYIINKEDKEKDHLSNSILKINKVKMTRFAEDYDSQKRNLDRSMRFSEERDLNDSLKNNSLNKSKSENNLNLTNNTNVNNTIQSSKFEYKSKNNLLEL